MGQPLEDVGADQNESETSERHAEGVVSDASDSSSSTGTDEEDEKIKAMLSCPCLDDLREGPCWDALKDGFTCFLRSKEEEQGADCVKEFAALQICLVENAGSYSKFLESAEEALLLNKPKRTE